MTSPSAWKNKLFFGDNLDVLRKHIPDESIDLVYLDPPFNSNATYNLLFREKDGTKAASQVHAFEDTWEWNTEAAAAFHDVVEHGTGRVSDALQACAWRIPNFQLNQTFGRTWYDAQNARFGHPFCSRGGHFFPTDPARRSAFGCR